MVKQSDKHKDFIVKIAKKVLSISGKICKKTSNDLKKKAVLDFVLTKSSLREVGQKFGVSQTSILNLLSVVSNETNYQGIDPSLCSGVIQIDGKEIKVFAKKRTILLSIDAKTKQPLTYHISNRENKETTKIFLETLKKYPLKIKGIISDFGREKCFLSVVKKVFTEIPHQICLVHFKRYVRLFIPPTKRSKY